MGSCPKVYESFSHVFVYADTVFVQTLSPDAAKRQEDILPNVLPVAPCFYLLPLKKKIEFYQEAMWDVFWASHLTSDAHGRERTFSDSFTHVAPLELK